MNDELPTEIFEAARTLENWFAMRGAKTWELNGVCSRNHAELLRQSDKDKTDSAASYAIPDRVETRNQKFRFSGVEYEWTGVFCAIITSYERRVKLGDVRMIAGVPFGASMVNRGARRWWQKPEVWWSIPNVRPEWIRDFKKAVFAS